MEMEKVRALGDAELRSEQAKVAEQLFRIRFAQGLGRQEGLGQIRELKKDVARMKTVARERQIAQAKEKVGQ